MDLQNRRYEKVVSCEKQKAGNLCHGKTAGKKILKFKLVNQGEVIKYRLKGWAKYNRILEYNAPCQKDIGFFFMTVHIAAELIGNGKNTEMDALIDMWINTVYML